MVKNGWANLEQSSHLGKYCPIGKSEENALDLFEYPLEVILCQKFESCEDCLWKRLACYCDDCVCCSKIFAGVAYFCSFLTVRIKEITLCRLVLNARRPVNSHALVNTADLARSTCLLTRKCYAGTLPPLSSRLSSNLWLTRT